MKTIAALSLLSGKSQPYWRLIDAMYYANINNMSMSIWHRLHEENSDIAINIIATIDDSTRRITADKIRRLEMIEQKRAKKKWTKRQKGVI